MQLRTHQLYGVSTLDNIVWVQVQVPVKVAALDGAAAAEDLVRYLGSVVRRRDSSYVGVINDIRNAPNVIGPRTLAAAEMLFSTMEETKTPLAMLLNPRAPMQRQQFGEVRKQCAPQYSMLTETLEHARAWIERAKS